GWPACGEIDIMEHWGNNQNFVQSAMHTPSSSGATVNHAGQTIPTASSAFHIYTLEWSSTQMIFSVDGIVHYIYNPAIKNASTWPYDAEQYILLNIAIEPSIAASFTQDTMEIDYVRVYQEGFASIKENEVSKSHNFFPNPANDNITIELGENHTENIKVKIFSIQGKLIKSVSQQTEGTNLKIDDLGDLPKGLYMVNYKINGKNYNLKFVKS
ncbi:MAG: family 16 glycosylhydrolase, partial [Flavobacteriales bacterium]|nr:family 16 glycosylhydrolase [Flavobacteriales bacterium]